MLPHQIIEKTLNTQCALLYNNHEIFEKYIKLHAQDFLKDFNHILELLNNDEQKRIIKIKEQFMMYNEQLVTINKAHIDRYQECINNHIEKLKSISNWENAEERVYIESLKRALKDDMEKIMHNYRNKLYQIENEKAVVMKKIIHETQMLEEIMIENINERLNITEKDI